MNITNDIENPPIPHEIIDIVEENISLIEHENIDEVFSLKMDDNLQKIRNEFAKTIHSNPNPFLYDNSDSPLTLSYNNSDDEGQRDHDRHFKSLSLEEIEQSLDKYYDDSDNKFSSELDILITFMKGQKNLYIQCYLLSQRKLNCLMIPAILISTSLTFLSSTFSSCESKWNLGLTSILNGITTLLITIVNYLKLETSTQTFYNTARQFDKLETSLEFVASKIMFVDEEMDKSKIVFEQIQEIETKISELKEWNSLFIPDEIRGIFPIICHINIFSFIKRMESNKKTLILRFKDIKNEIRYIYSRKNIQSNEKRINKRLKHLLECKEKIKDELNYYRSAYSYIDELFTIEIKNAREKSICNLFNTKEVFLNDFNNPVVDKYLHCIFSKK